MAKHILLAEDDEDDFELFREAARHTGLDIIITHVTYCDGVFTYTNENVMPDILILDGMLPGKGLIECISDVRKEAPWKQVPLIVLSGSNQKSIVESCYAAGVNLYLEKRNSFDELTDLIKRICFVDWSFTPVVSSGEFYALAV